jgi:pyruvate dehydrogenase kinase 2/3/4
MSAGFRITPALWDRIHHFASFPQTGGKLVILSPSQKSHKLDHSFTAANGALWTESQSRNFVKSKPIPRWSVFPRSRYDSDELYPVVQRNCPYGLHIESRSSMSCRTTSARCLLSTRSRTGMPSRSTCVVAARVTRRQSHVAPQELITFPSITLPPDIRQALMTPRSDEITLPESIPNPSLKGAAFTSGNGANGNGFNKLKLRVPMERRCVCV